MHCVRLLFAVGLAASLYGAAKRPIVLTTDCGVEMDDQWAIAHMVLAPEFDVRAIVTTHSGKNRALTAPEAEDSARKAADLLRQIPLRLRPDVIAGSSVPLPSRTPLRNPGVERILTESRKFSPKNRLTVVVIGAATDTASALLADPTLSQRIEVIAMGFHAWPQGGKEFNVENDLIAWQVILDSEVPVTVGDGAVSKRDLTLNSARAHAVLDPAGKPGRYLAGLLDQWLTARPKVAQDVTGDPTRWPVWDEVTTAYMLGLTKAERRNRPKLRNDFTFDHSEQGRVLTWVTAVDSDRLWSDLARRLGAKQAPAREAAKAAGSGSR